VAPFVFLDATMKASSSQLAENPHAYHDSDDVWVDVCIATKMTVREYKRMVDRNGAGVTVTISDSTAHLQRSAFPATRQS